jgi:uncharacterized protein YbjT (DUF2867 family)
MTTVLVTGATGTVGAQVVRELQAQAVPVRALVRDPEAAAARLGPVELAVGDFADRASLRRALQGVSRVFLSSADGPDKVAHEQAVIDAAAEVGIERIVKLSAINAGMDSPLPTFAWHGAIEHHLHRSGVRAVVLRAGFFMTNLLMVAGGVASTGQLYAPAGDARIAMVDPADVAAAAAALLGGGHAGGCYELAGGEAISFADVAQAVAAATGRPVTFVNVPTDAAPAAFENGRNPPWLVAQLLGVFALIREGRYAQPSDTLPTLTGRAPRTIGDFARDYANAFGGTERTVDAVGGRT